MARLTEAAEVREEIVRALGLDLIGPWAGHPLADERLPGWVRPSNWYLTGFLVPRGRAGRAARRRGRGRRVRGRGDALGSATTRRKTGGRRRRASSPRRWDSASW